MSDRYAVIGNPVQHSKSPQIHAAFAAATRQNLTYTALLAPLDGFAETVRGFISESGRGANVTVPFKQEAYSLCTQRTPRAEAAKAVNTLSFERGVIAGDNTDGAGLVTDLKANLGFRLAGARILLVGAGGAARGVVQPLLEERPATLVVVNRTEDKGRELAAAWEDNDWRVPVDASAFAALGGAFDLVVNATAASLAGEAPPLAPSVYAPGCLAYDMMYGKGETPFLRAAREAGARTADGLGMLIEQAAEAFFVWRGIRPDTAPVFKLLRTP